MGCNTKGFIHSENASRFNFIDLIKFIEKEYGEIKTLYPSSSGYMTISFMDNKDGRMLSVFQGYKSYIDEDYPKFKNNNGNNFSKPYITLFDLGLWGNSIDIITKIIKYFGGGYIIENDCGEKDWYLIKGEKQ